MAKDVPISQVKIIVTPYTAAGSLSSTDYELKRITNFRGDRRFPVRKQHSISAFNIGFWIRPDDFGFSFDIDVNDPNYPVLEALAHDHNMFDMAIQPRTFNDSDGESAMRNLSKTLIKARITGIRDTIIMDDIPASTIECEFLEYKYDPIRGSTGFGPVGDGDFDNLEAQLSSYLE